MNWLANGDRNTNAFHIQASKRRKKNAVKGLLDKHGVWKEEEHEKTAIIKDFFSDIFMSRMPTVEELENVVGKIEERISSEDATFLDKPYDADEVRRAVFDMHPMKSPGPDGFNARFFQRFWPVIGEEVTEAVLTVLNNEGEISDWNQTLICLIPKKEKPELVVDFRPISLCNTSYKIVSKVIVNRLRKVLGKVIDQEQSAFIKGRLITDNVLIAFECQHWLRNRKKGKEGFAALKIDMSKAYDRVEWNYLEAVMRRMGFPIKCYELIMRCVRSVSFSFQLNRKVYGEIQSTRGLRQGDPLSPFLFVICAQGFSSLLRHYEKQGRITGVPIVTRELSISHLFFADDSLLFFKATVPEAEAIKEVLLLYEKASGQLINFTKSCICFSPNTLRTSVAAIKEKLNITTSEGAQMYLGLPSFSLRQKRLQFGYLKEKVQKKLMGWNQWDFSAGGKEVLIKAVIQAIPTYAMQCFSIPDSICDDISS